MHKEYTLYTTRKYENKSVSLHVYGSISKIQNILHGKGWSPMMKINRIVEQALTNIVIALEFEKFIHVR